MQKLKEIASNSYLDLNDVFKRKVYLVLYRCILKGQILESIV
jgi:hypothetical protein